MSEYQIIQRQDKRILIINGKEYETMYSKRIIELIIKRKGLARTPEYFVHKEKRKNLLMPLFDYLESQGLRNLKVLEVGCSAGQFTELLNEQDSIEEIYSYDVDRLLTEVTRIKVDELGLKKVKRVDCFSNQETKNLPYENNYFDLIILSGVLEHLPFENRYMYVDEYYRKLKIGGLLCFLDTPNRNYPFETHSIGLPFINKLSAQTAFIYAKVFGKLKGVDFPGFTRAGTGWRNATYYECLPHAISMVVKDISEEAGYGYSFFKKIPRGIKSKIFLSPWFALLRYLSIKLDFPISFFLPYINVVFKKIHDFENSL
jgi:ubiquinone/menaquinone biosynthesis C-methylase UbiE